MRKFFDPPIPLREKFIIPVVFSGLFISLFLVYKDIGIRGYCPTLGATPVCYLTANAYIFILLSVFFVKKSLKDLFFFSGFFMGISLAIYFSIMHLLYIHHCSIVYSTPSCFYDLFSFLTIFIVKMIKI